MKKKLFSSAGLPLLIVLCIFGLFVLCGCGEQEQTTLESSEGTAAEGSVADDPLSLTESYILSKVSDLPAGQIGVDWFFFGLARSGADVPEGLFAAYEQSLADSFAETDGVLSETKYTEYARTAMVVAAMGFDPHNVGGYDIVLPLGDYDNTVRQGINGSIWALITLNGLGEEAPANPDAATQATCAMYLQAILDAQLEDGGFALTGTEADSDVTAMALTALSFYQTEENVAAAIERGLSCLSAIQDEDGGFSTYGEGTCESNAQVLTALSSLNISVEDERFVKNGKTVYDALLGYALEDGSFMHTASLGTADQMATEQAFYAMVAKDRMENGLSALYAISN